jgi:hypothetical protein
VTKNLTPNYVTVEEATSLVRDYVANAYASGGVSIWPIAVALARRALRAEIEGEHAAKLDIRQREKIHALSRHHRDELARMRRELDRAMDHASERDDEIELLRARALTADTRRRLAEERLANIVNLRRSAS